MSNILWPNSITLGPVKIFLLKSKILKVFYLFNCESIEYLPHFLYFFSILVKWYFRRKFTFNDYEIRPKIKHCRYFFYSKSEQSLTIFSLKHLGKRNRIKRTQLNQRRSLIVPKEVHITTNQYNFVLFNAIFYMFTDIQLKKKKRDEKEHN